MKALLQNKQLLYLFLCNFAIVFIGFGLFPVLPLYAAEFGASPSFIGIYLAITYIAISIGSILAGQLSERVSYKTLFTVAGLLGTVSLLLLGAANALWQVTILTASSGLRAGSVCRSPVSSLPCMSHPPSAGRHLVCLP